MIPGWIANLQLALPAGKEDVMAQHDTELNETNRLIASNKVEGTAVYNRQGEKLGSVYNFMVDKRSGKVEYAVMSFGGFLGMGDSYHPLPWNVLTYDTRQGGYVVDLDKRMLQEGPSYKSGQEPRYDRAYGEKVYGYTACLIRCKKSGAACRSSLSERITERRGSAPPPRASPATRHSHPRTAKGYRTFDIARSRGDRAQAALLGKLSAVTKP